MLFKKSAELFSQIYFFIKIKIKSQIPILVKMFYNQTGYLTTIVFVISLTLSDIAFTLITPDFVGLIVAIIRPS